MSVTSEPVCTWRDLPAGTYAVSVIQDENSNGSLDLNTFGVPTEGYGASNNVLPATSAPRFVDSTLTLDGTAKRGALQIQSEDLLLGKMGFQLQGAQYLPQLACRAAAATIAQGWVDDACHLHGQGGATGDDAAVAEHLHPGAQHGNRVDAGVSPKPTVFVAQQSLQVQRRNGFRRGRIAPHPACIGKRAQGTAIAGGDDGGGVAGFGER